MLTCRYIILGRRAMRFQIAVSMPIANAHGGRCHAWKPYFNRVTQRGCFWPHCLGSREELLSLYKFVMSLFVYWWCVMTGLGLGASLVCSPLRTEYHQQKTWVVQNKFPDCRNHVTGLAFDFILFFYYLTNMCSFQIWRLQIRKKRSTWMTQRSKVSQIQIPKITRRQPVLHLRDLLRAPSSAGNLRNRGLCRWRYSLVMTNIAMERSTIW